MNSHLVDQVEVVWRRGAQLVSEMAMDLIQVSVSLTDEICVPHR